MPATPHDPREPRQPTPPSRRRSLVALVTACVVAARAASVGRRAPALAADPTLTPAARGSSRRPIPDLIRLGDDRARSSGAATGTASGCRSTARAVAPWPARPRRRSSPTTTRARPSDRSRRARRSGSACCPAGRPRRRRRCSSTAGWRPGRSTASPDRSRSTRRCALIPTTTSTATGPRTTWRLRVTGRERRRPARRRRSRPASSSAARRPAACSSSGPSRARTTASAGVLRIIASSTTPTVNVVDELPPRDVPARRRPGRDAVDLADAGAQGPGDRRPARMPLAGCARASRTTTSPTTRARRSTTARSARRRRRTRSSARPPGVVLRSPSGAIANTLFHSTGGGATENNENVYVSSTGAKVAGAVSYLRGSSDRAPDGSAYDAASPYATWATRTYTVAQLSAWFAADARTERRDADDARPARPRRVGPAHQRDPHRQRRARRRCPATSSGRSSTPKRPSADPMMRSTLVATAPIP